MIVLITRSALPFVRGVLTLVNRCSILCSRAQGHECVMLRISSILLPVVGVVLFYRIRTFFQDLFQKRPGGMLGLDRKDRPIQLPGEIIDGNKRK